MKSRFTQTEGFRHSGFTLVELLVVVLVIAVLAVLSLSGYRFTMKRMQMARTTENMRQLAVGTILYPQDHNGCIPRGDDGADGAGLGGRGIIWINHIAPNIGYPELETQVLNKSRDGLDQWIYLLTRYKTAPFVCGGFVGKELEISKRTTIDAIGGIGYNVNPLATSKTGLGPNNASWGSPSGPIPLSSVSHQSTRCMYASSYDWHLVNSGARAYHRFGKNKAAMVFWDGSCTLVSKTEYDRAITSPDLR